MSACFDDTLILKITLGKIIVSHQNDNLAPMFFSLEKGCFNRQTCGSVTANVPLSPMYRITQTWNESPSPPPPPPPPWQTNMEISLKTSQLATQLVTSAREVLSNAKGGYVAISAVCRPNTLPFYARCFPDVFKRSTDISSFVISYLAQ